MTHSNIVSDNAAARVSAENCSGSTMLRTKEIPFYISNSASLFLLTFSFCLLNGRIILGDQDTYWHIVTGEWIWSHQAFPHFDEYSHTMAGAPWIAKEWL